MMKNSIFLSLCIYNLEVLTYNLMKLFIEILTRSPIILALVLNFARLTLIEPGSERDWGRGSPINPNPNKHGHFSKKCDL